MEDDTLLHRQVAESWVQQGRITSQVFKPTAKDMGRLSVYDGDMIAPDESWKHYTETLQFESVGVVGVTVEECGRAKVPVASDPAPFPEHAAIDFNGFSRSESESKSKKLKRYAQGRGWTFQP